jgi:hypothetical protein
LGFNFFSIVAVIGWLHGNFKQENLKEIIFALIILLFFFILFAIFLLQTAKILKKIK